MTHVVTRYFRPPSEPDRLEVRCDGVVLLDIPMGIGGPLHPESAAAARSRPWFYTGSPFGAEIVELAQQRGVSCAVPELLRRPA